MRAWQRVLIGLVAKTALIAWSLGAGSVMAGAEAVDWSQELRTAPDAPPVAEARLTSDGKSARLSVEIKDPHVAPEPSIEHGDHVEVWLAAIPTPSEVVRDDIKNFYLLDDQADPKALADEMRSPHLLLCGKDREPLSADEREQIRQGLFGDKPPTLQKTQVFFGMVHLGLFPDGRAPVVYDRSLYTGSGGLGPVERGVRYRAERTATGWRLEATLAPEAFGFFPRGGLHTLRVRVDAFDGDRTPQLATTASVQRWGEPLTFAEVTFARPLQAPLVRDFPLGTLDAMWPELFTLNKAGWFAVERHADSAVTKFGDCYVTADHVKQVYFSQIGIHGPKSESLGNLVVKRWDLGEPGGSGNETLVKVGDQPTLRVGEYLSAFSFGDATPGILAAEYSLEGDPEKHCGAGPVAHLKIIRLVKGAAPLELALARIDSCRGSAEIGTLSVAGVSESSEWSLQHATRWIKKGRVLRLTLPVERGDSDSKLDTQSWELSWDPDGSGLTTKTAR